MKYGVISYSGSINIGDEVQSVAALRLLPRIDYYIERDSIDKPITDDPVKLICNGWFTENPLSWPPADNIIPLFLSMHVTQSNRSYKTLLNKNLRTYYEKFGPVGCRDLGTLRLFKEAGVDAWYSSDLTLTLENRFSERNEDILLVDPLRYNYTKPYRDYIISQIVPKKHIDRVKIINQRRTKTDISIEQRFEDAETLIEQYSKASLVITSRIHCALPCLALGTPVYFINAGYHSKYLNLNDRFEGLLDLFRSFNEDMFPYASKSIIHLLKRTFHVYKNQKIKQLPVDWESPEPNPIDINPLKEQLKKKVKEFITTEGG